MTVDGRFERELPGLLEQIGAGPPPDYRDLVVRQVAANRQRPAWTYPERWLPVDYATRQVSATPFNWRPVAILALLLLAAAIGALVVANWRPPVIPAPPYGVAGNGVMAYAFEGDIYLYDPTSDSSRVIVAGPEEDAGPMFSPDGLKLAFTRASGSGVQGVIANADGSGLRVVPGEPCQTCTGWAWSGDSRTMLVTTTDPGGAIVLVDTVTDTTVVIDVPGTVHAATFRPPDDREIAYIAGNPTAGDSLHVVDRDGRSAPRLIAAASEIPGVGYSPDGSWMGYQAYTAADDRWTAHIVRSDGNADTVLEHPPKVVWQGAPEWSPDGRTLLIFRNYDDGTSRVALVRPDGSTVREYRQATVFGDRIFSPDGTKILNIPNEHAKDRGFCPQNVASCPVVLVDVEDGSVSPLPIPAAVEDTAWQRRAPD